MESNSGCPLLVLENANGRVEIALEHGDVWKMGRSTNCSIAIRDEAISRNHAMIQRTDEKYYFIDLGSQNGSFVNDRRVGTPVVLKNGDRISVGLTKILFQDSTQASEEAPLTLTEYNSTKQIFAQRLVTVLVVDIRDYTVLTNATDQSVMCQLIGSWFSSAEHIMQKYRSTVQKYIGDAVMALWVHQNVEDEQGDLLQILEALLEFVEATKRVGDRFDLAARLRIGAGLSTGVAAVGSPGTGDLTALGDTVNAAFRLEKVTKELAADVVLGQISFESLRSLPNSCQFFHANQVKLKGYEGLVKTWAISFQQLGEFLQQLRRGTTPPASNSST